MIKAVDNFLTFFFKFEAVQGYQVLPNYYGNLGMKGLIKFSRMRMY